MDTNIGITAANCSISYKCKDKLFRYVLRCCNCHNYKYVICDCHATDQVHGAYLNLTLRKMHEEYDEWEPLTHFIYLFTILQDVSYLM